VAATLRRELEVDVDLEEGRYAEFAVFVDGDELIRGGPLTFLGVIPSARKIRELIEQRMRGAR
jgi:hypothetical protein